MIVPMKQITLLCLEDDRAQTLQALQELGVLHLHSLAAPESRDVEILRRELESTKDCIRLLSRMLDDSEKDLLQLTPPQESPAQAVDQVRILQARKKNLEEKKDALSAEKSKLAPFGDFESQTIHDLAENGIFVRLYHIPSRDLPEAPAGAVLSVLHSDMQGHAVALIDTNPSSSLDAREFTPPSRSLSELETELNETIADLNRVQEEFERRTPLIDQIRQYQTSLEDQTALAEARAGMQASEKIAYLQGFCPVPKLDTLSQAAKSHGWGLVIEDPDPDLRVPTLIQNPGWVRPIRAVFDMIGIMPGYEEVDISALFLLFLSLFFAILVGDAGYGILFLGLTAVLRAKNKTAPPEGFRLLNIFSVATIIWGVLTGNYFGINPAFLPAPLAALRLDWLSPDAIGQDAADANFMTLTFLIGAIHLSIAHLWNFVRTINSTRALAQLGWICLTWTMFFMARFMVLSVPLPGFVPWLFVIGLILIVIFMTPFRELKKEWTGHVMLALDVISNFVDVVSYVRLFAVGSASLAVAVAFNQMAIGNGVNSIVSGLIAAIILFMGHALNILLCAMGVLVHGVRLNTLEFSGHVGMQWAGFKYNPFARRAQPNQDLTQSVE